MTLTLQEIRDHSPCQSGWKKLTKAVGNDMTTKLSIGDVVISNGLTDALWCLRCLDPRKRVAAIMPTVKRASVYTDDQRVHDCINDIEKWLAGDNSITLFAVEEATRAAQAAEQAAKSAAWAAAQAAAWAAWAARTAARAEEAAEQAARSAAWAEEAAEQAAKSAAWAAAQEAERELQKSDLLKMFPPMILKGE